jgi:hypothetical protein
MVVVSFFLYIHVSELMYTEVLIPSSKEPSSLLSEYIYYCHVYSH